MLSDDTSSNALLTEFLPPVETRGNYNLGETSKDRSYDGELAELTDAFENDYDADITIKHENVRHRLCIYMALAGHTNLEIAERVGYEPQYVSKVLRQPWARKRMISETRKEGMELRERLATEGLKALNNLVVLANDVTKKQEVQLAANKELLERWLGKASQPIVTIDGGKAQDLSDEELDKRIAERIKPRSN